MNCPHCNKKVPGLIDKEVKKDILKLHKQGLSLRTIETITGVAFGYCGYIVRGDK